MKPLLYISGPYSAPTVGERLQNIALARDRMIRVLASGMWWPVCPHTHTAGLEIDAPDISHDEYLKLDLAMLSACDALWVSAPADTVEYSHGVAAEIAWAIAAGMPVFSAFETPDKERLPKPQNAYTHFGKRPLIEHYNYALADLRHLRIPECGYALAHAVATVDGWIAAGDVPDPADYKGSALRPTKETRQ